MYRANIHQTYIRCIACFLNLLSLMLYQSIVLYRLIISPWLGNCCRFHPSCSIYAQTALLRFGFLKGMRLMLLRLCRCHPFHPGGVDLVPPCHKKD